MTTAIFQHNQATKTELAMSAAMWLGLSNRLNDYAEGSPRRSQVGDALTETAITGQEKFGWEAWGHAVHTLTEQFPNHDFAQSHSRQVVWFVKNA
jgi:hypothetical protein